MNIYLFISLVFNAELKNISLIVKANLYRVKTMNSLGDTHNYFQNAVRPTITA